MRDCTREKEFSARWNYIGFRGTSFTTDLRVHDATFVARAEDECTVVRLGRVYGSAPDANGA